MTSTWSNFSAQSLRLTAQIRLRSPNSWSRASRMACCSDGSSEAVASYRIRISGRLRMARASASFCRCASDRRPPPTPVRRLQPDLDHPLVQAELVQHLRDQLADALGRLRLAVGDLAEQDVVLQAGRGGVALGIEERHAAAQLLGQMLPEQAARLEHPRLQGLVHQVQTMPRRRQLERQRDQALAILATERVQPARIGPGGQRPVLGQIVGADEAELAEVLVIGRQIDEQLDHGGGDLEPTSTRVSVRPARSRVCWT